MTDTERLAGFLYILMRDYVPSGVPEKIMLEHVDGLRQGPSYSNLHLLGHAREIAERINIEASEARVR